MTQPINNRNGIFFSPIDVSAETFLKIVSFLSPKNIAQLLTVSREWHEYAGSNLLWKQLCPSLSVENPRDHFYLSCYPDLTGTHFANAARNAQITTLKLLMSLHEKTCLKVFGEKIIASTPYENYGQQIQIWDRA